MRHLDLFTGIGGFSLAASWVWGEDHEIVSFCEIEPYCQKVLEKHWPDVPCHDDIKTLKGDSFGTIDLITGGFPCQPFSTAGKQGGSSDDRYLWPEMFRVVQEAKPAWIIGENVAGLINMVEFEQCFLDLESEGYEVQAFIIPACAKDAKHRRDRIWIVANNDGKCCRTSRPRKIQENSTTKTSPTGKQSRTMADNDSLRMERPRAKHQTAGIVGKGEDVADTKDTNGRRTDGPDYRRRGDKKTGRCSKSGGGVQHWLPEPPVGRVANGVPSRVDRLKGLGNAIVPQVVVPIMQAIKSIEDNL
jgi:DNA (cytosine-5)-methyltransferase 1